MTLAGVLAAVLTVVGAMTAVAALYLFALALAAFAFQESPRRLPPRSRLAVLVPAHNEADLVSRCVASLRKQDYPPDCFQVLVIADNCTDDTRAIAEAAGADVLVREAPDARGKGRALRWAMDQVLAGAEPPDALVIVDADSVADPGLLTGLTGHLERGAEAVQGLYLVLDDGASPRVQLRAAAFLLFHWVRFAGRAALHCPCNLVGNGMLLSRTLIDRRPWDAFSGAEDLEYSLTLRMAGVRPVFAASALVRGPAAASERSAQTQRERWEGGRLYVVRTALPRLLREVVRRRRIGLVDAVVDLVVPPLGLLAVLVITGLALAPALIGAGVMPLWTIAPWVTAVGALTGYVIAGLRAAHAPAWMYRRLISTPVFLVQKLIGTLGVVRSRRADKWIRTERPSEVVS